MATKKNPSGGEAAKAASPALVKYLIASARVTLTGGDLEGTTVEEDRGTYKLASCAIPYATFRIEGTEFVLRLRKPHPDPACDEHLPFFREADGWLELRTPLSRDPRPWLEAGVGFIAGRLIRESGGAGGLP